MIRREQSTKVCQTCKIEKFTGRFYVSFDKDENVIYDSDCKVCRNRKEKAYRHLYCHFSMALESSRKRAERRNYKPCDATPEELIAAYTGKCYICGKTEGENGRRMNLDYNHNTEANNFRGFLCSSCSIKFERDNAFSPEAKAYLERAEERGTQDPSE